MVKTTVYLPADLKRAVEHIAAASGRSEADVIRQAISDMASSMARPRPTPGIISGDGLPLDYEAAMVGFGEH